MTPVYDEARKIKYKAGMRGVMSAPQKRLRFFNGAVTRHGDGVWMDAHDHLKSDLFSILDAHADKLKDAMLKFCVNIHKRFNLMCAEKGSEDEREVELRQSLREKTLEARKFYQQELLPAATKFFTSYKSCLRSERQEMAFQNLEHGVGASLSTHNFRSYSLRADGGNYCS